MTDEALKEECAMWREEALRQRRRCRMLEAEHSRVLSGYAALKDRVALLEHQLAVVGKLA